MNRKYPLIVLRLLSMLCLIATLASCATRPAASTPTPTIPSQPTAITTPTPIEYLARNEIVITGLANDVEKLVSADNKRLVSNTPAPGHQILGKLLMEASFKDSSATLNPRNENQLSLSPQTKVPTTSLFSSQGTKVVVRVYKHRDDYSTLINDINSINASASGPQLYAEPNWYISSSASGPEACAFPHSGGGSPVGTVIKDRQDINNDAFKLQWAFTNISLPSTSPPVDAKMPKPAIIILDTVPAQFQDKDDIQIQNKDYVQSTPLNGPEHFPIYIQDSLKIYSQNNPPLNIPTPSPDRKPITNHGWLIAGIIAGIFHDKPQAADIYLFRVLDDYGCGDIGLIGTKIVDAINMLDDGKRSIVINASFGTYYDPNISIFPNQKNQIASFQQILYELPFHHAIMVAAAGNNSSSDHVMPMNFPANYDSVIGVAASTKDNGRSCFSNQGDIAAPGGNADTEHSCIPINSDINPCPTVSMADCQYTVIGPVKQSTSGFGAWAGTSFSTAFISGIVANALANPYVNGDQDLVVCMLKKGAQLSDPYLGVGIVNIERTLAEETINTCKSSLPQ